MRGDIELLPRVVIHNEASLDGRVTGFPPHMGLYYEVACRLGEDATLAGADTILAAPDQVTEETEEDLRALRGEPESGKPLLVVPDSRGRVRVWHQLRRWPFWGRFVALVSKATPAEYLKYLGERNVDIIVTGDDHVHLRAALEELGKRYGVRLVRTDSGGTLNGVLISEGLVDEVSLLLSPCLVGDEGETPLFQMPGPRSGPFDLHLTKAEELGEGVVWLRYDVVR